MDMRLKKILSIAITFGLIAAMLGGCQKKENNHGLDPKSPTTITIWHYYNGVQQEQFDRLLMEFNETVGSEQGIIVEGFNKNTVNDLASCALASIRKDVGVEAAPDMFIAYSGTAYTADQLDAVVDLTPYFTDEELSEYVEGYLNEGDLNNVGELKAFPIAKSTEVMMLNLTDWRAFADATGISEDELSTWEGVARTAEKYYEYSDGKAFFGRDAVANYMLVGAKQLGIEFVTLQDGSLSMNADKDVVRRLWDNYYVPYVKGYYYANGRYRSDDAQTGDIIAMVCSVPGATYFPQMVTSDDEHAYPIESLTLPVPNFEGTDPYVVQQGAGMVVLKSEEKKEYACFVFLKWFTEVERSIDFSGSSGYLPVRKAANDFAAIAAGFESEGASANGMLLNVVEVAVSEINSYEMYASKPYDTAEGVRGFLETFIHDTAKEVHDAAAARIESGESRDAVMDEYTSDAAFDAWYHEFVSNLQDTAGI